MNIVRTSLRSASSWNTASPCVFHTDDFDLYSVRLSSSAEVYSIKPVISFFLLVMFMMAVVAVSHSSKMVGDTLEP